ncbi:nucleotidyltransferase [Anaerobacterium chartisolvens]|uniref:Nucleotidyltransferase n=1 Tax=Anaerobacterium chartisolvens TaxID=1297424 RepID=A0A369BD21_9FIRM|nr:NDP-sugar synthase [Anaerobacterium chartisolvens]RCX19460.1 nucleotidyltransferase [Anaerobacterium chartisolvens]
MKALFLAGGKGIRLQPSTDKVPKPMVPIMNKPLLERTMVHLKKSGISEIVISSCYQPQYIEEYFGNGKQFGLKIQYIVEDIPLGTGGAIKKAEAQFEDTFIVFNADILSDIDIPKMLDCHKNRHAIATIAITEVSDPSAYGVIDHDTDGYAISFVEKPVQGQIDSSYINAGIYIFEPEILKEIPNNRVVSAEREIFPRFIVKGHKIAAYKHDGYWMDIGTFEKYIQVHKDIMDNKCKMVDCNFSSSNISLGKNVKIHPDSKIIGPAYIGDNVEICAKAIISHSVIGDNVSIGSRSRVTGSILWNDINISSEVRLVNTIVTSNCFINRNLNYLNTVFSHKLDRQIPV